MTTRRFQIHTMGIVLAAFLCASTGAYAQDILMESSDACVTSGMDERALNRKFLELGWEEIDPGALTPLHQSLFAVHFLGKAAYKTEHSRTWKQAWNEGLAHASRHVARGRIESKFSSSKFYALPSQDGLVHLTTRSVPPRSSLSCLVTVSEEPTAFDRPLAHDPSSRRVVPEGSLRLFANKRLNVGWLEVSLRGVVLDQDLITEILGEPIPATSYVTTYVGRLLEK